MKFGLFYVWPLMQYWIKFFRFIGILMLVFFYIQNPHFDLATFLICTYIQAPRILHWRRSIVVVAVKNQSEPYHSNHVFPFSLHTELKYSIAGVEFQATKQFILSSFCTRWYLFWWSNRLRHQASSQKAVGSIPTWGDFFFKCSFFKEFFFLKL